MSATKKYQREWWKRQPFWRRAERLAAQTLRDMGVSCTLISREKKSWDIVTKSGQTIECKAARVLRGRVKHDKRWRTVRCPFWAIGIARPKGRRHVLREQGVDFYAIRVLGGDCGKVWPILSTPLKTKQLQVTFRLLVTKYAKYVEAWHLITDNEHRGKRVSRALPAMRRMEEQNDDNSRDGRELGIVI